MTKYFLSIRGFLLVVAMATLLFAGGCGDDDSSEADANGEEVTVETSSLSKAEFIKQADTLCEKTKGQFFREYTTFIKDSARATQSEQAQTAEMVETILVPMYEDLIDQISSIGAPKGDEKQVAGFLNALQQDLDFASEQPSKALDRLVPFSRATKAAEAYGLAGCAESFGA